MVRKRVDEELQRDLTGKQLKVFLEKAGLPKDYPDLSPRNRFLARLSVLRAWFDPERPHILCTDVNAYLSAHFLWSEYYIKPAEQNRGVYFFDDPLCKYQMVNTVMSPSINDEEPSKSLIVATRRLGKTQTLVVEMPTLLAICRPFTTCLISEVNDTRTKEELHKIKTQVEENSRIHSDFGAEGQLFPRGSSRGTWTGHHLQFIHQPGCEVLGHSMGSAQRGRGPLFGIIDDPEDEENSYNQIWRKAFFRKLFDVYLGMFHGGGKIVWIGTPVHSGSCLSLAIKGMAEHEDDKDAMVDPRFRDWRRGKFSVITQDDKGEYHSIQPQRLTVQGFMKKMEIDPISARKEILCEPVTPGMRAFSYDPFKHGFMHCQDGTKEYMIDLFTGEQKPWDDFLKELRVFGAGDLADGQSVEADPGALIFIGVDPTGIIFVLDAYIKRCFAEALIDMSFSLSELWDCERFGWEKAALQVVVSRIARRKAEELRAEGRTPPVLRDVDNIRKNKIRRILTMIPLFGRKEIRFLQFNPVKDAHGIVHTPVDHPRKAYYGELISQMVEYTDEGLRGHDDGIDGLEMAIRVAAGARGEALQSTEENKTDAVLEKWEQAGVSFTPQQVPRQVWTPKIIRRVEDELYSEFTDLNHLEELIPYT